LDVKMKFDTVTFVIAIWRNYTSEKVKCFLGNSVKRSINK
jgi:hypothetical protein